MCGIFCAFCENKENSTNTLNKAYESCVENLNRRGPDFNKSIQFNEDGHSFIFAASVLWLQGQQLSQQPLETKHSKFVYNGDVFGGKIKHEDRMKHGDTVLFLNLLEINETDDISQTLDGIEGPYAFIYLDVRKRKLYFGRDTFGRRSLLIGKNSCIILTSVARKDSGFDFMELPAIGTFIYDLERKKFGLHPWRWKNQNFFEKFEEVRGFLNQDVEIFEGKPVEYSIDYFVAPTEDLKISGSLPVEDLDECMARLLSNEVWLGKVETLRKLLEEAVKERIGTQPGFCQDCIHGGVPNCSHALSGVLFSGGVDCSILALLVDKFTHPDRPIDLLNVAFDRAKDFKSPDRITGLESLEELKKLRPDRHWNFVEINIKEEELNFEREKCIRHLIYPLGTILDDSLGCALWFSSRGSKNGYTSPCRVVLVGMGADELFGGYTRHRNALKRKGWRGLHDTLEEDWQNLSHRNLARDDRVVSDHGRQLRTPYLDEKFVQYVRKLNCWEKSHPSENLPQGFGEKILLRSLAYHLGLKGASMLKKRALQFGSRIANSKENAQDLSPRL